MPSYALVSLSPLEAAVDGAAAAMAGVGRLRKFADQGDAARIHFRWISAFGHFKTLDVAT